MDVLGMVNTAIDIGMEIKALVETVKANHEQCRYLFERVNMVITALPTYAEFKEISETEQAKLQTPMEQLLKVLRACRRQISKFSKKRIWLSEAWNAYTVQEKFERLNKQLTDTAGDVTLGAVLGHALQQAHTNLLAEERRQEDRFARETDSQVFRNMLHELTDIATETNLQARQWSHTSRKQHEIVITTLKKTAKTFRDKVNGIDKHFLIDPNNLVIDDNTTLDYGAVGFVKVATWFGKSVVVNIVKDCDIKKQRLFIRESEILWRVNAPHVLHFYGAYFDTERKLGIQILEHIQGCSLFKQLEIGSPALPARIKHHIAMETAHALSFLHTRGIEYADLNPASILLDSNCHVRMSGLAHAKISNLDVSSTSQKSTEMFCKPLEILKYSEERQFADIYSFGMVLWMLWSGKNNPFKVIQSEKQLSGTKGNLKKHLKSEKAGENPLNEKMYSDVPKEYRTLINDCRHIEPTKRPTLDAIIKRLSDITPPVEVKEKAEEYRQSLNLNAQAAMQETLPPHSNNTQSELATIGADILTNNLKDLVRPS